jgi:hypothetical protein
LKYNANTASIYRNGQLNGTISGLANIATSTAWTIGNTESGISGASEFQGYIYEVLVYNFALTNTQQQIVESYLKNKYERAYLQ